MAVGYTYSVEKECPICLKQMQVTKTRSRLIKVSQDADFCMHYKDFNPYYYSIWVCPHCGYASDESHFGKLSDKNREEIASFLKKKEVKMQYNEIRNREEAVAAFKLAIFFAGMVDSKPSHMGGLYLKLAWLYRESEEKGKEDEVLARALDYYDKSLTTERYPIGSMTDTAVMYLIGALNYRLGHVDQATQYLSKVVGSERARLEPAVYNLARNLWQDIRKEREGVEAEKGKKAK